MWTGRKQRMRDEREHAQIRGLVRKGIIGAADVLCIGAAYFLALCLRFDFAVAAIPERYIVSYVISMPFWMVSSILVFYLCQLYHGILKMAGISELLRIVKSYVLLAPVYGVGAWVMKLHMPASYYAVGFLLSFCMTVGVRFAYRLWQFCRQEAESGKDAPDQVMIIGAGKAGATLARELLSSDKLQVHVCCFIDDDKNKKGRVLCGIPILGGREVIGEAVEKYGINMIIYAIPTSSDETRRAILNICKDTRCRLLTVPGIYQLINGEVLLSSVRKVEITDLLGRPQIRVNDEEISSVIQGKTILVTGGGGSIGSELCRQIAGAGVRRLIIFDMYENNAYDIQQELKRRYPELDLVTLIGSIRNVKRVDKIMKELRPDIVFHAAAHKHVPLMEESPNEAIKNNTIGTWNVATAAARYGVKKFILISSDKAVNPTNIMGASKRLCEMVIQMADRQFPDTEFAAVRFGNVLGSNGSVIPLFKKQIAEGGPVTVTDKNVIRYFMTIPEAVSLVLQACHYAKGGEIFVLDMGEPVRIDDMARNLIRLSGYVPDVDIKIEYTGLRPGEKLFEELLMDEEGLQATANDLIHIGKPIQMDDEWFREKLFELDEASYQEETRIRELVEELVPTYHPSDVLERTLESLRVSAGTDRADTGESGAAGEKEGWRYPAQNRWGDVACLCSPGGGQESAFGNESRGVL